MVRPLRGGEPGIAGRIPPNHRINSWDRAEAMNGHYDFATLIAPCSVEGFLADYWEKKFLYIERRDENYYDNILRFTDIENSIFSKHIMDTSLRLVKDGADLPLKLPFTLQKFTYPS